MRAKRSLRGKIAGVLFRIFTKRRPAATRAGLARQARRIMGLPRPLSALWSWRTGIAIDRVRRGGVECERLRWRTPAIDGLKPSLAISDSCACGSIDGFKPSCCVVYFHGGGYLCCSPQTHRPNTVTLTRLLRAETFVPDYRLAPEHPFPAAVDDALSIYRALCETTDPKRVVFAGDSAGGGLAIATAIHARDNGLPLPSSILTFSPWVDLTSNREAQLRPREHLDDMFYAESFAAYSDAYLQGVDPRTPLASPLFASLTNLPPLLIEVSDTELLYPEAVQLRERWMEAGNRVALNVSAGLPHGWQEVTPVLPEARESLQRAVEFALKYLA